MRSWRGAVAAGSGRSTAPSLLATRAALAAQAAHAAGDGGEATLLSVRLDGLDHVGDALGKVARDGVAAEAGSRVRGCLPAAAALEWLNVDELAVLLPQVGQDEGLEVAERILQSLRHPVTVGGVSVAAPGSIGVATGAADLAQLLRAARMAMHTARDEGGDRMRAYSSQLLHEARRTLGLASELRAAVADGQLRVYYQPIVETLSGQVRSVEALVRWEHPTFGLLTPPQFLDVAEGTGQMVAIGRQVLDLLCTQLVEWRTQWPNLAVAFNVSEAELLEPDFAEHILTTLRRHRLPASALHLEVTETVAVGEQTIAAVLEPLARAGVACSLDDFGTGHSSLHRLRQLPVQRLKVDKSFVDEVGVGRGGAPLLAAIIALAHSVGHRVVAEGVETPDQAAFLASQGCDELQGYLFSRPVPASEVPALLGARPTARTRGLAETAGHCHA